jgi:hypothetical protein
MTDYALSGHAVPPELASQLGPLLRDQVRQAHKSDPKYGDTPPFLVESLLFPYTEGLAFIAALRASGGWERVNGAFGRLPASTEEILHPAKYVAGDDPPVEVPKDRFDRAEGIGKVLSTNVFGEFGIRAMLTGPLTAEEAAAAASGWGGDRYWLVTRTDGADALLWALRWDDEAGAGRLAAAWLRARPGDRAGFFRSGNRLFVAIGVPPASAKRLADLWLKGT